MVTHFVLYTFSSALLRNLCFSSGQALIGRDVVLVSETEIAEIEIEVGGPIGMGEGQASLMVVSAVIGSSISSSGSSSNGGIILPVTCNTVEYSLTLDCSSRSTFVRVVINFVEVLLLQLNAVANWAECGHSPWGVSVVYG